MKNFLTFFVVVVELENVKREHTKEREKQKEKNKCGLSAAEFMQIHIPELKY